jgi:transcriptional regulator with XRE-family HTH domain
MTEALGARPKRENQRKAKLPPRVPIKFIRLAAHLSIDAVIARIHQHTGRTYSRGSISAIENGHRGASSEILEALEVAYSLPLGSISTDYVPRGPRGPRVKSADVEQVSAIRSTLHVERAVPDRSPPAHPDNRFSRQASLPSKALDRIECTRPQR